jgi:anti-sigma factor RsiW
VKTEESDKAISNIFKRHRGEITYAMPEDLNGKILNALFPKTKERISFLSWMSFGGGAIATCLALMMAFQFGKMSGGGPGDQVLTEEVVSSHVRSLMAAHLSDVVSTDQHTVKPWFVGKIDFGPTVKDFAKDGFPLIGGRLDYIDGRSTAALIYKSNQHIINVLQFPASSAKASGPRLTTIRGYQVYSWSKDGMNFWGVSDLNAADLRKFVSLWQ